MNTQTSVKSQMSAISCNRRIDVLEIYIRYLDTRKVGHPHSVSNQIDVSVQ